jgi:serine/threonine-protein kinase
METNTGVSEQQDRLTEVLGNKYHVLCRIGGGGMAQVYLARHRMHGGLFAVKVLVDHLAQDPRVVSRFEQEARMAATLAAHPNIVPIFDIGSGAGLHYMIMQFIAGEDLASYLRREGRLSLPAAANVVVQAAEALSCAEARRIVHRDLKPANMLLDESGRIKLLDFGISRIADFADGLTRPGESLGTPFYMSPEQIRGEACDIRSDLYSLGVVFFELISGRRPFENESATAIQIAHLSSPAPSLLSIDPALPAGCDAMVQKLLAKQPEERYQSTAELLQDLAAHGAQNGASSLRPKVNPPLQQAIAGAEAIPLEETTARTRAVQTPSPSEAAAIIPAAVSMPQTAPAAPTPEAASPEHKSHAKWIAAGALILLVIVAAVGFVVLRPAKAPTAHTAAMGDTQSALPQLYSDAHGRMLLVSAGPFHFGERGTTAEKTIDLPAFYIDETEVSNAEYRRFCEATGHAAPQTADYKTQPDHPVSGISFKEAQAYASWAGKRLPTEAEWEKAARGTDEREFPWGDIPWTSGVPNQIQSVTSEPDRRSPSGAYNMAGNVWEWTRSSYSPTPSDIAGMKRLMGSSNFSSTWQVIKGGSYSPGGSDYFAIAKGRGLSIDGHSPLIGFRCVRDATSAAR